MDRDTTGSKLTGFMLSEVESRFQNSVVFVIL
jgi:hypothetical protein